ncbi:MAG TPA: hypothetical protein VNV16_02300 [Methylibium sp.]|nr:hypothetical protein [Methylibium sp.]
MKRATESGMGPVCERRSAPLPTYERDLLGYDVDRAVEVARERVRIVIESAVVEAHIQVRRQFVAARKRLGVWR